MSEVIFKTAHNGDLTAEEFWDTLLPITQEVLLTGKKFGGEMSWINALSPEQKKAMSELLQRLRDERGIKTKDGDVENIRNSENNA